MRVSASAPGKLVVLGEYAVLEGAPALVMAVDRRCRATLASSEDAVCRLELRAAARERIERAPGEPTGAALVDLVVGAGGAGLPPWCGSIDSSALYAGSAKLGLGSSAAALVAWAGAWAAWAVGHGRPDPGTGLERLVALHRAAQGGAGSGLDVAAALAGGLVSFSLDSADLPRAGAVRWPNGVAFAGIFAGRSASTPGFVARFRNWQAERRAAAAELVGSLRQTAEAGTAAAAGNDGDAFVAAVAAYGRGLDELGRAMGAQIVTSEHRAVAAAANRFGVAYKVSGAGGGDLGLAVSRDAAALEAFARAVAPEHPVLEMNLDARGLVVEERH